MTYRLEGGCSGVRRRTSSLWLGGYLLLIERRNSRSKPMTSIKEKVTDLMDIIIAGSVAVALTVIVASAAAGADFD